MSNHLRQTGASIGSRATMRACLVAAMVAGAVGVGGCSSRSGEIESGPEFPTKAQSGSIDIQVFRDETVIRMTNTTARVLAPGRIWINRWFSHDFPGLAIGESITMELGEFTDTYGDRFRAGGFFATDRPTKVVQAQLEINDELVGLIVVGNQE